VVWPGNEKSKGKIGKVGENSVGVKGRDRSRARERERQREVAERWSAAFFWATIAIQLTVKTN